MSCAVTGSVHTPSLSPALPITAEEIATQSIAAVKAGAAVLHLHARNPKDGRPDARPATYRPFVEEIAARTDAIINITTGGSTDMTVEDRLAAAKELSPELASLNMGSMNFVFEGIAAKRSVWEYDWEEPYIRGSSSRIFANTFDQIEYTMRELGDGHGTRFEFECYDVGHLYSLAHFVDRGLVRPPFFIQSVLGIIGGIGADMANLSHMMTIADKLFGEDYYLSCFAAGRNQKSFAAHSVAAGAHVRVGLEDNLYAGRGRLATGNDQQVEYARGIVHALDREVAAPADVRDMLGLKGAAATAIGRS
ncbi:3-keto-5-aminohexanoate cleavage protein [Microbacterium sp. zg.B48]|uniref:3-keto-5-aminohexanoate cleavage protein n=1 Tax=Microbacterium sp. zg.B48 TaxID=2969408 RepID=UPI00214B8E9A|nr:3-keto-5-aminohexanoate cleavage protein [Microbacterium sp. zg.B48]MCR2765011.1 3-keto-5-aminohexanoate cleavage protein [Microbacterium sp. zg.B48]